MTGQQIRKLREDMGLTQAQFGALLNAHLVTVSRWENDLNPVKPDLYQAAMIDEFAQIQERKKVGDMVKTALIGAGIAAALFLVLKAAQSGGK
jgi:transcriptional regulator with XRE-family HTH domain